MNILGINIGGPAAAQAPARAPMLDLTQPILKRNIFEIGVDAIVGTIDAAVERLTGGRETDSVAAAPDRSGGSSFFASIGFGNAGSMFGRERAAPEIAPVQEVALVTQAPQKYDPHHVDMAEIGNFASPIIGKSVGRSTGASLGMNA